MSANSLRSALRKGSSSISVPGDGELGVDALVEAESVCFKIVRISNIVEIIDDPTWGAEDSWGHLGDER